MSTEAQVKGMSLEDGYATVELQRTNGGRAIAGSIWSFQDFIDNAFDETVTSVAKGTRSAYLWNTAIGDGGSANIVYGNRAAFEFRQMNEEHGGTQIMGKAIRDITGLPITTIPDRK